MAVYNQNYDFINLVLSGGNDSNGYYDSWDFGNNSNISTAHAILCISAGTITIGSENTPSSFTFSMTPGQRVDMFPGWCTIVSGQFIAISAQKEYYYPGGYIQIVRNGFFTNESGGTFTYENGQICDLEYQYQNGQ